MAAHTLPNSFFSWEISIESKKNHKNTKKNYQNNKAMARGNQRELARQKNLKKQQEAGKSKKGDKNKRMENDADILRAKQKAADERKAAAELEKLKQGKK
ncbi:unnamed protein product [Ambrosiozyma monospora]|uniref:Unnamed protein product n=1 Tax=Ambrosiozyma monospora TaxID=43982 RepID=A0A9W6YTE3_AMBMO|nr:unnamed protein product [Ambrosiozyma monospora]